MHLEKLPRFPLTQLPTPLAELPALTKTLGGPRLWIKRDDQTGLALGAELSGQVGEFRRTLGSLDPVFMGTEEAVEQQISLGYSAR